MEVGKIKCFYPERGFGFITAENGDEVFYHVSGIEKGSEEDMRVYLSGYNVAYTIGNTRKGKAAFNVTPIPADMVEIAKKIPYVTTKGYVEGLKNAHNH